MGYQDRDKDDKTAHDGKPKRPSGKKGRRGRSGQPRKDSSSKRVNFDNERESKFRDMEVTGKCNDISWYSQNPELLKSASSLSFFTTTGLKPTLGRATGAVPGICALAWSPTVGGANNQAIRQAANQVYSYTVHANSRNYAYTPSDQMLLILAGAQVFSMVSLGMRAYGVMNNFNGLDFYTPKALLSAMGFQYNDLRNNLSKMWFDLNHIVAKTKQIWIPNTMPLIERWYWLNANIYKDGDSPKSQYYLFAPVNVWQYDETTEETGGSLQSKPWLSESAHTWQQYLDLINGMIDALLESEDRGIIMGDLLKAYGAEKIYALNPIGSDYTVTPVYDQEVLSQIENASITGFYGGGVTQDNAKDLTQQWNWYNITSINSSYLTCLSNEVLNFHTMDSPTPEMNMIATRLKVLGATLGGYAPESTTGGGATAQIVPYAAGTEIIYNAGIYFYDWASGSPVLTIRNFSKQYFNSSDTNFKLFMSKWCALDWAPWVYPNTNVPSITASTAIGSRVDGTANLSFGDYDNYTIINADELLKMHTAALYSLLGIPQI